ncbi:Thiol-disulfide isomerase or thioredoxin [Sediminibacterium ginsengisoli]|uniref:Thiol-disulfide isomerase or thioredoxin n=2 Tax=Sediminibacterium ginsengisoli TaxID=413434 RepID=A0A1T4MGW9_9BACT|nr:Thiol-disulfide isomerase or thioredoxin [Sediminibacterium ginsengisoli]
MAILLPLLIYSQQPSLRSLTIGDEVPDIRLSNILNYPVSNIQLSSLKNKPVILDFFGTWCGSCIAALPHLDSLQRKFDTSVQILVVCYEPTAKIRAFLKENPKAKGLKLPFVTADSILSNWFPHRAFPHEVWIDGNRKVSAITEARHVNEANLRKWFSGIALSLPFKYEQMKFDAGRSFFERGNGEIPPKFLFQSALSGYMTAIGGRTQGESKGIYPGTTRYYYLNYSVLALYRRVIEDRLPGNRIILEVQDSARFVLPADAKQRTDWQQKNLYCYEVTAPDLTPKSQLMQQMLSDLNNNLHLNGRIEQKRVKCRILIRNEKVQVANSGLPAESHVSKNGFSLRNKPVRTLLSHLNNWNIQERIPPIVLDETNYKGNIDLALQISDIRDLQALRAALQPFGLDMTEEERLVEVLVLTEKTP